MNDLQNGSKKMYDIIRYLTVINPRIRKAKNTVVYSKAEGHWSDSMSTQAVKTFTVVV